MNYQKIIQKAIDLHVHIGPEIIPRKFDLSGIINYEKGKLKGIGIKNHFFPTVTMELARKAKSNPIIIHSVVLNHYVGGFNPYVVKASADLTNSTIIVWFPTIHASGFLAGQPFEIPKEWLDQKIIKKIKLQKSKDIPPLSILSQNETIRKDVNEVLLAIKKHGAILATGHLSWEEARLLVIAAVKKFGIKKIILTHPIYQNINMPIAVQQELSGLGAFIEHSYSMHTIDKIPISKIAKQIKAVGAENCILSSDVGQTFSKSPSEALLDFIKLLEKEGISEKEFVTMLIKNPSLLIRK